jgi:K+-transporting ATPase ATPase C chain
MKKIIHSLRAYLVFTLLLGLVYPLAITLIAQVAAPGKANGSLLVRGNKVVGSSLLGQSFADARYFYSRPSANNYDGTNSGATNYGPSSKKLMETTADKIKQARQTNALAADVAIPADMVLSSASGLDPHISVANALLQLRRVAAARHMPEDDLKKRINEHIDPDFIGLWGRPGVNVVALNLALDDMTGGTKDTTNGGNK